MLRKPIIAGNWKMHKTRKEAEELTTGLIKELKDIQDVEIVLCPPFTALCRVARLIEGTNLLLGAQNLYHEPEGAYTGEISPLMLRELGCSYVIIGHSERREYFGEMDGSINKKIHLALDYGLSPILCVGERLSEREARIEEEVVYNQLIRALKGISRDEIERVVIAYEPVWAIGTGKTATPSDSEKMHLFIRKTISSIFNDGISQRIRIQYGGSVTQDNIDGLMSKPDIDGVLVGTASLSINSFSRIVKFRRKDSCTKE